MEHPYKTDAYVEGQKGIAELRQLAGIHDYVSRDTILNLLDEEANGIKPLLCDVRELFDDTADAF